MWVNPWQEITIAAPREITIAARAPGAVVCTQNRTQCHLPVNHFTLQTNWKALTSVACLHSKKCTTGFVPFQIFLFSYLEMANADLIVTILFFDVPERLIFLMIYNQNLRLQAGISCFLGSRTVFYGGAKSRIIFSAAISLLAVCSLCLVPRGHWKPKAMLSVQALNNLQS